MKLSPRLNREYLMTDSLVIKFLIFIVIFLFCSWILPRREFDFTDYGYCLYNAYLIAHGVIPTLGYGGIINGLFMFFGIHHYLFFEIIYCLGFCASAVLFFRSFEHSLDLVFLLLLGIGLFNKVIFIFNYQNSPEIFLFLTFACFNFSTHAKTIANKRLWLILTAILLALSAMVNISLLPATVINIMFLGLLLKNERSKFTFFSVYLAVCTTLILFYSHSSEAFWIAGNLHHDSFLILIQTIPKLLHYLFFTNPIATVSLPLFGFYRYIETRTKNKYLRYFSPVMALVYIVFLFSYSYFIVDSIPGIDLYNFSVNLLLGLLGLLILNLERTSSYLKLLTFSFITVMYACDLAITAGTPLFSYHLFLFSGLYLFLLALNFELLINSNVYKRYYQLAWLFILIILSMICINSSIHFSYRADTLLANKKVIKHGTFYGVYASNDKQSAFSFIETFYQKNQCENKFFLAYPSLPLLYYAFDRVAPNNKPWISSHLAISNSTSLINQLSQQKHWCIIIAPTFNNGKPNYLQDLTTYITTHSQTITHYTTSNFQPPSSKAPTQITAYQK